MKRFLSFLATGALALSLTSLASAQNRGIAGGSLILDDGSGHTLTIETPAMTCNSTYVLPLIPCGIYDGNIFDAGLLPPGNAEGQMLYWNMENSAWQTLNIGETGQVLTVNGSDPSWMAATTGVTTDLPSGDIPMSNGSTFVASSLTDNGTTVNTPEDISPNTLTLPNLFTFSSPSQNDLSLTSIDNTFNLHLNTDATDGPGAGQFNAYFSGNSSPTFQITDDAVIFNNGNEELDLGGGGEAGNSGQFLQSQGSGFTPTWANAVTEVDAGTGLSGGPITTTGTLSIANTGVEGGTYGDGSDIPQFTVNDQGQLTSAGTVAVMISNENLTSSSITIGTLDGSGLAGGGSVSLGSEIDLSIGGGGVTNAMLANDAVTVNAGAGMSGGGTVTLGGAPITLTNAGVTSVTGTANQISTTGSTGDITLSLAAGALNSLLPTQTGNGGEFLTTNGTSTSWAPVTGGTVSSVATGTGLTGGPITTTGTISLATQATHTLLGNPTAGTAAPEAVTLGTGLSFTGTTLNGNVGTVTSVATGTGLTGGPITGSGTISLATQANATLLGNNSGGAAAPGAITLGTGLSFAGTVLNGNAGTVTSVATGTGLTGGPITGSGTISLATQATATLLGNPTAGTAAPEAITLGTGLSFSGTVLNATGGSAGNGEVVGGLLSGTTLTGNDWNPATYGSANAATGSFANSNVMIITRSGTIKDLFVGLGAASGNNGHYWTFTLFDVTTSTAGPTCRAGGTTTTGSDVSTTLTVSAGDIVTMEIAPSTAAPTETTGTWTFEVQ